MDYAAQTIRIDLVFELPESVSSKISACNMVIITLQKLHASAGFNKRTRPAVNPAHE